MKKLLPLLLLVAFNYCWAQVPQKMSYQAVIRNNTNALVTNTAIGIKISLLQSTSTGTALYVETHSAQTNDNGLVTLQIGAGNVISGNFSSINWANGPYFIKTETDPSGGSNYSIAGTTELLSVPYALAAGQSSPAPGTAVGDMYYWNGSAWVLLPIGAAGQVLKVENNIPKWTTPAQGTLSTVTTDSVADIKAKQVTITGTVANDGGEFVLTRGFCYGTSPNPTVSNTVITSGTGLGTFTETIQGLTVSTLYYVRAFATTIAGTSYGSSLSFTTTNGIGIVTTSAVTNNQQCYVTCGGTVVTDGGDPITVAGICFSTTANPTVNDNIAGTANNYAISTQLTTPQPNTLYYYRAYCTNSTGTYYGAVLSFTSLNFTANVTTSAATQVKSCSATLSMNYTELMPNAVESYGILYNTSPLPDVTNYNNFINLTAGNFSTDLSCLQSNTTYYVRAFVYNSCYGYKYGNQITFTTSNNAFTVTTYNPTLIKACSMQIPLNSLNGGDGSCTSIASGIEYNTTPMPAPNTIGSTNSGSNGYYIYSLTPNTIYYFRGYTIRCDGTTVYGNQVQASTLPKYTSILTNPTTDITTGTATLNASVIANGQDYTYFGICYGTSPNPTISNQSFYFNANTSSSTFSKPIQGLTPNTTYYARVFVHDGPSNCLGISYGNQVSFTTTNGPLVVGQYYQGGIIIKLNTATTGIIAATTDQGIAPWGCEGTSINGTSSAIGTGQANTNAIISGCTTAGTAAKICDALVLNGKSDWYLPSEQELLLANQLTYFSNNNYDYPNGNSLSYWSSTQTSANQAKIINGGTSADLNKSDATIRVRAVRSF